MPCQSGTRQLISPEPPLYVAISLACQFIAAAWCRRVQLDAIGRLSCRCQRCALLPSQRAYILTWWFAMLWVSSIGYRSICHHSTNRMFFPLVCLLCSVSCLLFYILSILPVLSLLPVPCPLLSVTCYICPLSITYILVGLGTERYAKRNRNRQNVSARAVSWHSRKDSLPGFDICSLIVVAASQIW